MVLGNDDGIKFSEAAITKHHKVLAGHGPPEALVGDPSFPLLASGVCWQSLAFLDL